MNSKRRNSGSDLDQGCCGHDMTYHSVEFASLVTLCAPIGGFMLAGAELAEILGRLGYRVGEKVEFDPAQWFSCRLERNEGSLAGIFNETCVTVKVKRRILSLMRSPSSSSLGWTRSAIKEILACSIFVEVHSALKIFQTYFQEK